MNDGAEREALPPGNGLRVRAGLVIPDGELEVRTSRSGGPGGQNVNKVSTRVEVRFDIARSVALDPAQKTRLLERLAHRTSRAGVLRVVGQRSRSQARNLEEARGRLAEILDAALREPRRRRATRPTAASRRARVEDKRHHSERKTSRRPPRESD